MQRLGFALVHCQASPDRVLPIILTLEQLSTALIADAIARAGREDHVIHRPAPLAGTPPAQTLNELNLWDRDTQYVVDIHFACREHLFQDVRLRHIARKAVEQKSVVAVGNLDSIRQKSDDELVGNEVTPIHVLLCFFPQCRLRPYSGPKEIAGRNVWHTQALLNEL